MSYFHSIDSDIFLDGLSSKEGPRTYNAQTWKKQVRPTNRFIPQTTAYVPLRLNYFWLDS
jgi:hypothetical protein